MDEARNQRWVGGSFALAMFEKFMVPVAQQLGRLDCQLLAEDQRYMALSQDNRETIEEAIRFDHQLTMSYLWVLGAYELVRTVDQRARDNLALLGSDQRDAITQVKQRFARLRVPLAKMEPAAAFRDTDTAIAYSALVRDHGIGWLIGSTGITRKELADDLLALLDKLRGATPPAVPDAG